MTQPYRYQPYTVRYLPLLDEAALLVHRTQRRQAISTISGQPRSIYGKLKTPIADDAIVGIYRLHREEHVNATDPA